MVDEVIDYDIYNEQEPVCKDGDWKCMLDNIYVGYLLFVEAHVKVGEDTVDGEVIPIIEVNKIDVTGMETEEINTVVEYVKRIYPDAVVYKLHFCGNHMGRPCKIIDV